MPLLVSRKRSSKSNLRRKYRSKRVLKRSRLQKLMIHLTVLLTGKTHRISIKFRACLDRTCQRLMSPRRITRPHQRLDYSRGLIHSPIYPLSTKRQLDTRMKSLHKPRVISQSSQRKRPLTLKLILVKDSQGRSTP